MGVWGLQSYVENCPDIFWKVSLKEMADAHRRKFNCRPELVVDGMNFMFELFNRSGLEWIYDAQWLQIKEHLKESLDKFRRIDVKLVFFFDGTVSSSKIETWRQRRLQNYEKIEEIFRDIENLGQLSEKWKEEGGSRIPTSTRIVSCFLLKELEGELGASEVFQTDREADEEMVRYAKSDSVFGILSQDTDFMIYDTKDFFSLKHLNMDTLETSFYDRCGLARKLSLHVKQLPLFACLLGNNTIPYNKLENFHSHLLRAGEFQSRRAPPIQTRSVSNKALLRRINKISSISRLIREKIWNGDTIDWGKLRSESNGVLGTEEKELIEKRSKSYVVEERVTLKPVNSIPRNLEEEILKRHEDCRTADIFNILFFGEYGSTDVMEKVFDKAKTSVLIYREIRQRCYGILFNFSQSPSVYPRVVEEYCAYIGNALDEPELVTPLPLKILIRDKVPAIDDIWFKYNVEEKYKVFWATLQLPMDLDKMMKIPKDYLVFSCIINFLVRGSSIGPHLEPFDVAVFVAQAVWEKNIPELKELQVPFIIPRAVNLTTLFMRGVAMVLLTLGVCDYPFPFAYADPCHFFDGKQFHYLYSTAVNENRTVKYLCQTHNRTELFYSLLEVVTNNTEYDIKNYNWKHELEDFEH